MIQDMKYIHSGSILKDIVEYKYNLKTKFWVNWRDRIKFYSHTFTWLPLKSTGTTCTSKDIIFTYFAHFWFGVIFSYNNKRIDVYRLEIVFI